MGDPTQLDVRADGVHVAVHDLGGDGPPVLLVHAAGFHGRVWGPLAGWLTDDYRCLAPDLRGHGDSPVRPDDDLDWCGFAADLLAVVDELGLTRPLGVGHSSGATALLLAEQSRPGTFRALYCFEPVLVPADPPLGRDPDNWLGEGARRRRFTFPSRDDALRHYADKPPMCDFNPAVLRSYVDHGVRDAGDGTVVLKCRPHHEALVYEMATAHHAFGRLPEVACPVVLARGERSEAASAPQAAQVAARLPQALTTELGGLGHFGPLEDPARVARSVRETLTGHATQE